MHSPVFLIGTQRSGTTLLCKMLTAHPDVFIKNELPVRSVFRPGASKEQIKERISFYIKERSGLDLESLLQKEGKSIWGLKDPELTNYLDQLELFLPEARFIIITRDARAVVNSYMKNKWGLGTNAYTGALRWLDETNRQLEFEARNHDAVLLIRYEDLVMDQFSTLCKVCEFINIPYKAEMTEYGSRASFVKVSRENKKTFEALDPKMTSKWEKELTGKQIRIVNGVCHSTLDKIGYPTSKEPLCISRFDVTYYRLHQIVLGELQIQYRWRLGKYRRQFKKAISYFKDKCSRVGRRS